MEKFSLHTPTHLELSVAWWTFANMHPTFAVHNYFDHKYTQKRMYQAHWYQLLVAAMKGEI